MDKEIFRFGKYKGVNINKVIPRKTIGQATIFG